MVTVAGLDTNPHEAHKATSTFMVTIISDNDTSRTIQDVGLGSLADLIKRNRVEVLAFDNLAELAPGLNKLLFELSKLGRSVQFVEVAHDEPLERKAERLELWRGGKLPPLQASLMVAKIAKLGYGKTLDLFAPKTIVRIVRRRVPGSGGSSTMRFKRKVESQIKFLANRILAKLRSAKLDFDFYARESTGGFASAMFVVYANPEDLRKVVYPSVNRDYAVKVERVVAKYRQVEPSPSRAIIVGYDPGTTSGVAVIGMGGELLALFSGRNLDRMEVASRCVKFGKPLLVCTDVAKPPEAVRKLSAAFGAKLFAPSENLSIQEKWELVRRRDPSEKTRTSHERDSLAAAAKAYSLYSRLIEDVKAQTLEEGLSKYLPEVLAQVFAGRNISAALSSIRQKYAEPETRPVRPVLEAPAANRPSVDFTAEMSLLKARAADAQAEIVRLREESEELRARLNKAVEERDSPIRREREVAALELRISELHKRSEEAEVRLVASEKVMGGVIKSIERFLGGEIEFVSVMEALTLSEMQKLISLNPSLRPGIVYVRNPIQYDVRVLETMNKAGIAGLVVPDATPAILPAFELQELPLLTASQSEFQEIPGAKLGFVAASALKLAHIRKAELKEKVKRQKVEEIRRLMSEE